MLRILAFLLFLPTALLAQGAPRTILVLDASGSMWGQIDGVNKIVIAREVIADLLQTLPAEQELGLMTYGHRRKGDCSDIEMLIEPGTDRAAIAAAVNAINPKGKTPLSAAVIQAAEALRYTEETATVILVSDGIETCNLDPCAVGRDLENAGIGFTAHVIGFDVADPEALAQLQCLAEETGGIFRTADTADELAEALDVVVTAPEPEPEPEPFTADVTFRAVEGENGPAINEGLRWNIGSDEGGPSVATSDAASFTIALPAATSRADVTRSADGATASAVFTLTEDSPGALTVTLVLPPLTPPAAVKGPATAPAGSLILVSWDGPNAERDYLTTAAPDMSGSQYITYTYLEEGDGNTLTLRMPPKPGPYVIRYILTNGNKILAAQTIEATPLTITMTPPEGATIGQVARVAWTGPDYERDYIAVARPDQPDGSYETYSYTEGGTPLDIRMPAEPGSYELRYVLGAFSHIAARVPFEVGDTASSVSGPAEAPAGATITVDWTGPDAERDYIAVAKLGSRDDQYDGYTYTEPGTPLKLTLPLEPGDYELRYVLNLDRRVLARSPITLTPVSATLDAPDSAPAGSELSVGWTGPDYDRDYVSIAEVGEKDDRYVAYGYTGNGNPVTFQAPTEPGNYELRYVANDNGKAVIARRPITIEAVTASLDAPAAAPAGSEITVAFTGPLEDQDSIILTNPDEGPKQAYEHVSTAARKGSPLTMRLPNKTGTYELRYMLGGRHGEIIARVLVEATAVTATLTAPATAPVGSDFEVAFTGPAEDMDSVILTAVDEPSGQPEEFDTALPRDGSPLELTMPIIPGTYELRYMLGGRHGEILDRTLIEATPETATVSGPATARAGEKFDVAFTGPGNDRDLVTIARPEADPNEYEDAKRADRGSPQQLTAPDAPGTWELRYQIGGSYGEIIARVPITIE